MSDLSEDQAEKRAAIQKSATIWGGIVGGIAGLLALWILGGQGGAVRFGGAVGIALIAGYLVFRTSFRSAAKSALCGKCGAAFSRSRSDHVETLTASEEKEERAEQEDKSVKVTTWTEDSFDVVDTYTCASCSDTTTKSYQITRRRDEETVVQPHMPPKKTAGPTSGDPTTKNGQKSADTRSGRGGSRKR